MEENKANNAEKNEDSAQLPSSAEGAALGSLAPGLLGSEASFPTETADKEESSEDITSLDGVAVTSATDQRSIAPGAEAADSTANKESDITREADITATGSALEPVAAGDQAEVVDVTENSLDHWATENVDDTEEAADEIGVSGDYDAYGREILRDVFENRLRLAPNSVKLSYSKLKNEVLAYKGVRRRYVGKEERFYAPAAEGENYGDVIVKFEIADDILIAEIGGENIEIRKLSSSASASLSSSAPQQAPAAQTGIDEENVSSVDINSTPERSNAAVTEGDEALELSSPRALEPVDKVDDSSLAPRLLGSEASFPAETADKEESSAETTSLDGIAVTSATDQRSIAPDAEAADITVNKESDITREADITATGSALEPVGEASASALAPLQSAVAAIEALARRRGFEKKPDYVRIAYAERYPFNPDAVLRGMHEEPPVEDAFDGPEYEPIDGELMRDLLGELIAEIADKEGKDKLDELRQEAQTMKDATALTEPIVYFYNVARDNENNVGYVTLQQVLNDKFLGKMLPQQFFAVAEGSKRVETLNILSIKEAAKAADMRPDLAVVTQASARLLIRDDILDRLVKAAKTENHNLVLAFDCALLEALGDRGLSGIRKLAENDVKIMIDNTENAGLKVLTEYNIDYLRFDARYYKEEDPRKTAHLDMVLGYAKVQGIKTAAIYVDTVKEARYMLTHGVLNIEGDIVGAPLRILANAIKQAKRLPVK